MPKKSVYGEFKIDPNLDLDELLESEIKSMRSFFDKWIDTIDKIEDQTMQLLCMFSLIDSIAQESNNYSGNNNTKIFCDFVLSHCKKFDYLNEIEPVTLFYDIEELIDDVVLIDGFPPEPEISLNFYSIESKTVPEFIKSKEAKEIVNYAKNKAPQKIERHRLIKLIYRMRDKAVHEMGSIGIEKYNKINLYNKKLINNEPYYFDIGRTYVEDNLIVSDGILELIIPNEFIREVMVDCIENYLIDCRENKRAPFSNNEITRKHNLTWYDK